MATPVADHPAPNDVELPPAVHWPTVYLMAGIGGGLVAVLAAVAVIAAAQAPPPQPPEETTPVAAAPPSSPSPSPRPVAQTAEPAAPADSGPPAWKPLVPHPEPPVPPPVAARPVIRTLDLVAVLQQNPVPPALPAKSFPTRPSPDEAQVFAELQRRATALDLNAVAGASARLLSKAAETAIDEDRPTDNGPSPRKNSTSSHGDAVLDLIAGRSDLAGLPVRGASECRAPKEAVKPLEELSKAIRIAQAEADRSLSDDRSYRDDSSVILRDRALVDALASQKDWLKDEYAPGLSQMLCAENPPVRLQLVKMLAATKGRAASVALARQALFDLNPDVRQAAINALKDRPPAEYRRTLVDGFRHPWPAVAEHAAAALTVVDDRGAVPALAQLLDLPDPAAPATNAKKQWVVAEVVKVNHLRNCLLCHAPSTDVKDPVRGFVPKPGRRSPSYIATRRTATSFAPT